MPAIHATTKAKKNAAMSYRQRDMMEFNTIVEERDPVPTTFQLASCTFSPCHSVWVARVTSCYYNTEVMEWCDISGIYEGYTLESIEEQIIDDYGVRVVFANA